MSNSFVYDLVRSTDLNGSTEFLIKRKNLTRNTVTRDTCNSSLVIIEEQWNLNNRVISIDDDEDKLKRLKISFVINFFKDEVSKKNLFWCALDSEPWTTIIESEKMFKFHAKTVEKYLIFLRNKNRTI